MAIRGSTWALLLAAAACTGTHDSSAASRPDPGTAADEAALYRSRIELRARTRADFESYDTVEPVRGATRYRPLPSASAAQRTIAADALAAAHDYAQRNASSALLVWRDGRVELESYFGEARTREQTILSRSLAKPLAAVAVARAIALGKIRSLDQPLADFLAEWRAGSAASGPDPQTIARRTRVTVRQLIGLTAGFAPQRPSVDPADIMNLSFLHPRHDEYIVRDYPIVDEPGTRFEYNNASFDLVALLIERATGMRYHDFLSRELLQPLGALGGEIWVNRPGGTAHAGCCIMLPPESWLRIGILLVDDGVWRGRRLLPAGFVREMSTGTALNPWYGLGVYVAGPYTQRRAWTAPERTPRELHVLHSEPYLAPDLFLFDGNGNQVLYVIPSRCLVILRTGSSPPRTADGAEWDNSRLPNLLLRGS